MNITLENLVLAHRYLYYVQAKPVISDAYYDELEKLALKFAPDGSPLHQPGSDLESSYSGEVKKLADCLAHET